MEVKCLNISKEVFNNDTLANLYVIKDDNGDLDSNSFIFCLPSYTFSWQAKSLDEIDRLKCSKFLPIQGIAKEKLIRIMMNVMKQRW